MRTRGNWFIAEVAAVCFVTAVALSNLMEPGVRVQKVTLAEETPVLNVWSHGLPPWFLRTRARIGIERVPFVVPARKAGSLNSRTVMAGWLSQTARLTAANYVRGEIRRARREQEACMQSDPNDQTEESWRHVVPILNGIIGDLREKDRDAIV